MEKYSNKICNIKNCKNKHYKIFLCKQHLKKYVINNKIRCILERQYRLKFGSGNYKDWGVFLLNNLFHHTVNISFYYVEHFPLESLFHFHIKNVDVKNNKFYTSEEFIKDFDYKSNYRIGYLKTHLKTKDSQDVILKFVEERLPNIPALFSFLFLIFAILFLSTQLFFDETIPAKDIFFKILLIGFALIPAIYFGKKYLDNCKQILKDALENNLYATISDNNRFLENCESIFNRKEIYIENKMTCIGAIIASMIFFLTSLKEYLENHSWYMSAFMYFLAILSFYMLRWVFEILWLNYFFMPLTRRFHDAPFKLNLYSLDKSSGLNSLKNLLRNLLIYDIFILSTLFTVANFIQSTQPIFVSILILLTAWNTTSLTVFIPKLSVVLHNQFTQVINDEKIRLSTSINNDRFAKYEFLEKLKLNIFFNFDVFKKLSLGIITFIISFVINYYDKEIMFFLKEYFRNNV